AARGAGGEAVAAGGDARSGPGGGRLGGAGGGATRRDRRDTAGGLGAAARPGGARQRARPLAEPLASPAARVRRVPLLADPRPAGPARRGAGGAVRLPLRLPLAAARRGDGAALPLALGAARARLPPRRRLRPLAAAAGGG